MCDAVIVDAIRTPIGRGKPTRGARRRPGRQHQPGRQTGARRGPDRSLPAATAMSLPDIVVRRHALTEERP